MLNGKLLETEKALRDEQAKRKILEDKLFQMVSQKQAQKAAESAPSDSHSTEAKDLFELANEEIARKDLQLRESKKQAEVFTGHNLEKRSRSELQQAQKQIADVLKIIN